MMETDTAKLDSNEPQDGFAIFVIGSRGYFKERKNASNFFYMPAMGVAPLRDAERAMLLLHRYDTPPLPSLEVRADLMGQAVCNRIKDAIEKAAGLVELSLLKEASATRPKQAMADAFTHGIDGCVVVHLDFAHLFEGELCEDKVEWAASAARAVGERFIAGMGPQAHWTVDPRDLAGDNFHIRAIEGARARQEAEALGWVSRAASSSKRVGL